MMKDREKQERWVTKAIAPDSMRAASIALGYSVGMISQRLRNGGLGADIVIAVCDHYGYPVLDALVETGYVSASDVASASIDTKAALERASSAELLEEIERRMAGGQIYGPDDMIGPQPDEDELWNPPASGNTPGRPW